MEDTVEQLIVDALVELLQALPSIVTAVDGRVIPFAIEDLPAAVVFTPKSEADAIGDYVTDHDLSVNIVLHLSERAAQRSIRALIAEVYAALGEAERDPSGPLGLPQVISFGDPAKAVKCTQAGDFIGSAQIALNIKYRTARWAM